MSDKLIKFIAERPVLKEFWPRPIGSEMPEWWKSMPAYGGFRNTDPGKKILGQDGDYNSTIKRCVPIADSLSLGYVLLTDQDIYMKLNTQKNEDGTIRGSNFEVVWKGGVTEGKQVEGHPFGQAKEHPLAKLYPGRDVFKMISPWHIITPPGYSTLFMPPMNNPNGFFEALPGVVDTDTYTNIVNFPFVINEMEMETIIPAGTPIVQVFPFKRESWKLETQPEPEDLSFLDIQRRKFRTHISSVYRKYFWQRKEFK
jgi:hypothetical protein